MSTYTPESASPEQRDSLGRDFLSILRGKLGTTCTAHRRMADSTLLRCTLQLGHREMHYDRQQQVRWSYSDNMFESQDPAVALWIAWSVVAVAVIVGLTLLFCHGIH